MAVAGLVGFTRALAAGGLGVGTDRTRTYLSTVAEVDVADPDQVYWAGRLTLCGDPDDIARYNEVFAQWFHTGARPGGAVPRRGRTRLGALVTPGGDGEAAGEPLVAHAGASDVELLRHRDLGELTASERAHLRELFAVLRVEPPKRRSLRQRLSRSGGLDPRRTVRAMLASGGEPTRLVHRSHAAKPRRVVLLIDVSGSMEPYADAMLRFAHTVVRRTPGAVEVFTLGTRLTRVSRQLRLRDPQHALDAAARTVPDFAGGTRLGETLRAFLDRWGQRGVARSAVVVLFSDGWERGDPALLGEQVQRLHRLAHTVLWVNPHAGRDGYAPVQSGIAAALPHIDRLLAGHSLATLTDLLREMRDARRG